jgi:hypothetical protein
LEPWAWKYGHCTCMNNFHALNEMHCLVLTGLSLCLGWGIMTLSVLDCIGSKSIMIDEWCFKKDFEGSSHGLIKAVEGLRESTEDIN